MNKLEDVMALLMVEARHIVKTVPDMSIDSDKDSIKFIIGGEKAYIYLLTESTSDYGDVVTGYWVNHATGLLSAQHANDLMLLLGVASRLGFLAEKIGIKASD